MTRWWSVEVEAAGGSREVVVVRWWKEKIDPPTSHDDSLVVGRGGRGEVSWL
jgi:hypothetical protein